MNIETKQFIEDNNLGHAISWLDRQIQYIYDSEFEIEYINENEIALLLIKIKSKYSVEQFKRLNTTLYNKMLSDGYEGLFKLSCLIQK